MIDTLVVRQLRIDNPTLTSMITELDSIGEWKKATTVNDTIDNNWRSSKVKFIHSSHYIGELCLNNVADVNKQGYNYDLRCYDNDQFQYAHYSVNDYYNWHVDIQKNRSKVFVRKLSFSLVLNDDYDGGVLEIAVPNSPDADNPYNIFHVPRKRGTLIVFPSHLLHRVTPVTHGIRKSIVGWFVGPPLR